MRIILTAFLVLLSLCPEALAQDKRLQIELAADHVDITTGFNGTSVAMFGTITGSGEIVVTLKGPERTMIVRRKDRVLGAWMNIERIEFRRVPSYYDYASTMTDAILAKYPDLLKQGEIGVDYLGLYPEDTREAEDVIDVFRDSLIRRMQQKGFFPIKVKSLTFLNKGFFKAVFELPPGVPTGNYTVEGMMVEDGKIVAQETKNLIVGQVGFNARVYSFAEDHSFLYGLLAVFIALVTGWSAFTFLRRD